MFGKTQVRWMMVWLVVVMVCAAPVSLLARIPTTPVVLGSDEAISPEVLQLQNTSKAFVVIGKQVIPTVVAIETKIKIERPETSEPVPFPFRDFFGDEFWRRFFAPPEGERRGLGSGVIVGKEGYILTNNHVIRGATTINVALSDGRKFENVEVIGTDPLTDLAVVQIAVKEGEDLPVIRLGDSDQLEVGEIVLAIGNPFAQYNTMTQGIVSALGRKGLQLGHGGPVYQNFIQTDAAINPGNSGGALVNLRGELVGINTAIETRNGGYQGIGFAIPANMARDVMEDLIKKGRVVRGYLGVYIQDVDSDMAEALGLGATWGALVGTVQEDGPADRAGIKEGDVILELNGQRVNDATHLMMLVARLEPGTKVKVKVFQDGKTKDIVVELGERPEKEAGPGVKPKIANKLGIEVQPLTDELAQRLGYEGEEGVLISAVQPGSVADEKGIHRGDLIKKIGQRRIRSVADYRTAMEELKEDKAVILLLKRGERSFFVALKVPKDQ